MCRLMDQVMPYNLKMNLFVYLHDLLKISMDFGEHLKHLQEEATQLRKANLTINMKKGSFAIRWVQYLGYIVGEGSLSIGTGKMQARLPYRNR